MKTNKFILMKLNKTITYSIYESEIIQLSKYTVFKF